MSSILAVARAHLRAHRVAIVAGGLLAGLFGAAALGALAGAERTATAYDRLMQATKIDDVRVAVYDLDLAEAITSLPHVERSWSADVVIGQVAGDQVIYLAAIAGPARPPQLFDPVLVEGREANPGDPSEVVLVEDFSRRAGVRLGDRLDLKLITREEFTQFAVGFGEPDGRNLALEVVGIVRAPDAGEGIVNVIGTPALYESLRGSESVTGRVVLAHLRGGRAQAGEFIDAVNRVATTSGSPREASEFQPFEFSVPAEGRGTAEASANVLVTGLLVIATVVLVAASFVIAQSISRRHDAGSDEQFVEAALGMTRFERALGRAIPSLMSGLIAATLASAGAFMSSRWTPAGIIASYEPSPGPRFHVLTMAIGAVAILLLVFTAELIGALRAGRPRKIGVRSKPSLFAERGAALGLKPPFVVGLRNAFERGAGERRVPTRSALIAMTVGLAGVVAVTVFAGSLARLSDTPERYGWAGDLLWVDLTPSARAALEKDKRVGALSVVQGGSTRTTEGRTITLYSVEQVRGSLSWTFLRGHEPRSPNEVVLGPRLADELDAELGDTLAFEDAQDRPTATGIIVGIGLGPQTNNESLGLNMLVHPRAFDTISNTDPFTGGYVRAAAGIDGRALAEELGAEAEVVAREKPPEVTNLENLGSLPNVLGILLAVVAAAAIANSLLVGTRRRGIDLGILKSIGFTRPDVSKVVLATGLASVIVAISIGTPIGMGVGATVWGTIARLTRVGDDPHVSIGRILTIAGCAFLLTCLISALPARRAARTSAAEALRTE